MEIVPFKFDEGFDAATFRFVQNQLGEELRDVYVVAGLESSLVELQTEKQQLLGDALQTAYKDVSDAIKVDGRARVTSILRYVLELVTIAAEEVPGYSQVLGVLNASIGFGSELANESDGTNHGALETTVDDLSHQAAAGFTASLSSLSQIFDYLYSNWGKLKAVATGLTEDAPAWDINATNRGELVELMGNAMRLSYYQTLVPLEYSSFEAQSAPTSDLARWCIWGVVAGGEFFCDDYGTGARFRYPINAYSYPVHAPTLGFADAHDNIVVGEGRINTSQVRFTLGPLPLKIGNGNEKGGALSAVSVPSLAL